MRYALVKFQVVRGDPNSEGNETRYDPRTKTIYYNPQAGLMTSNGAQTPAFGIVHEVGHALIHVEAIEGGKLNEYVKKAGDDVLTELSGQVPSEEKEVLQRFEIPAARKAGIPIRTQYDDGFLYETQGATTTKPTLLGREAIRKLTPGGER
jgi:hypothetical protein